MGDAIGKVIVLFVDALSPRAFRVSLVLVIAALAWTANERDKRIQKLEEKVVLIDIEIIGVRSDMKVIRTDVGVATDAAKEGNAELRTIRNILLSRPR